MHFDPSLLQSSIKLLHQPVTAKVSEVAEQVLRVKYGNTTWRAKLYLGDRPHPVLIPGQQIKIIGIEGTLAVLIQA